VLNILHLITAISSCFLCDLLNGFRLSFPRHGYSFTLALERLCFSSLYLATHGSTLVDCTFQERFEPFFASRLRKIDRLSLFHLFDHSPLLPPIRTELSCTFRISSQLWGMKDKERDPVIYDRRKGRGVVDVSLGNP